MSELVCSRISHFHQTIWSEETGNSETATYAAEDSLFDDERKTIAHFKHSSGAGESVVSDGIPLFIR